MRFVRQMKFWLAGGVIALGLLGTASPSSATTCIQNGEFLICLIRLNDNTYQLYVGKPISR